MVKEWEILCKRSEEFLEESPRLAEEDKWELAGFMLQQHCRLLLKCKLLKLEGSYQRTHSLRDLLRRLENYPDDVGKATVSEENYLQLACFHLVLGKCTQLQEELGCACCRQGIWMHGSAPLADDFCTL